MVDTVPLALADPVFRPYGLEVWRVDLDASQEPPREASAILDETERARLKRFVRVGDRARFACVRAALRQQLGDRLGLAPRDVPIHIDERGKPSLKGDAFRFSVAHSGDHGLLALSATAPVGVDLEQIRDHGRIEVLADLILSDSERSVWLSENCERRGALFLRAWTAKEALLKAVGSGLLTDPRALAVLGGGGALSIGGEASRLGFDPASAVARHLPVQAGYVAALAVLGTKSVSGMRATQ